MDRCAICNAQIPTPTPEEDAAAIAEYERTFPLGSKLDERIAVCWECYERVGPGKHPELLKQAESGYGHIVN